MVIVAGGWKLSDCSGGGLARVLPKENDSENEGACGSEGVSRGAPDWRLRA